MRIKIKFILINVLLLLFYSHAYSQESHDEILSKAIQEQIVSANNCETIAHSLTSKDVEADEFFKACVGRRALMIAIQIKYGPGTFGKVNSFDMIEAYSYLGASTNVLVQELAHSYSTAAGKN